MTRVRKMIIAKVAVRATKEMMTAKVRVAGSKKRIDKITRVMMEAKMIAISD